MVYEAVPVPDDEPSEIYFKKAIQECESEWAMNKKVVSLKEKDIRRSVPKGLPYFHVDFGLNDGYAHVIEDEEIFPKNFAQEIIGGMLDLEPRFWKNPKRESFEAQKARVLSFGATWKKFDNVTTSNQSDDDSSSSTSSDSD